MFHKQLIQNLMANFKAGFIGKITGNLGNITLSGYKKKQRVKARPGTN